ncbi:unnamed protein product [Acanthoscelides obtectus]|uniref:Uncharacterized protein n=1 Tax=Acanthoscelides obtectus TaxID=200917 RepID=A0A9P0PN74_ACAOB|nr:unnamed protein product [Acanthoscelides obtectus]CAK1662264.1 hypothetical protein AOBTE_LOCUS23063 [Acanthoscelides obtectus]
MFHRAMNQYKYTKLYPATHLQTSASCKDVKGPRSIPSTTSLCLFYPRIPYMAPIRKEISFHCLLSYEYSANLPIEYLPTMQISNDALSSDAPHVCLF